jgi:hypothetical protein
MAGPCSRLTPSIARSVATRGLGAPPIVRSSRLRWTTSRRVGSAKRRTKGARSETMRSAMKLHVALVARPRCAEDAGHASQVESDPNGDVCELDTP